MKTVKLLALTIVISLVSVQAPKAALSPVLGIAGVSSAGQVALAGLSLAGGSAAMVLTQPNGCMDYKYPGACIVLLYVGWTTGLILLDDQTHNITFSEIDLATAKKLGVSPEQREIYNLEVEEVNLIFKEISSQLDESSTVEQSRDLWNDYKDYLSEETFQSLQSIMNQH